MLLAGRAVLPARYACPAIRVRVVAHAADLSAHALPAFRYITDRIIAMGLPSSGLEGTYRNPMGEVQRFLETKHCGKYMVFNISERSYDAGKFEHRVINQGW